MATMQKEKVTFYRVTFSWGKDYGNVSPGVTNITINVMDVQNKFDGFATAFKLVSPLVNGQEPSTMSCESRERE